MRRKSTSVSGFSHDIDKISPADTDNQGIISPSPNDSAGVLMDYIKKGKEKHEHDKKNHTRLQVIK